MCIRDSGRGHHVTRGGMVFMAIGATNEQGLAVDPQPAATDFHRPKAHVDVYKRQSYVWTENQHFENTA